MKLKWQTQIKNLSDGTMHDAHAKQFIMFKGRLFHTFSSNGKIYIISIDMSNGSYKSIETKTKSIINYREIKYHTASDNLYVYLDAWYKIKPKSIKKMINCAFLNVQNEIISFENRKYVFDDKTVHFPSPRTIECIDSETKEPIWKHVLKGYPYTKIEYIDGNLFFGTAGKGGALYNIELSCGKIKRDASTKGTANYCWYKDSIISYTEKGNLQKLNPYSNEQIELLKMETRIGNDVPMLIVDNMLFTVSFSRKNKDVWPKPIYLLCVELP